MHTHETVGHLSTEVLYLLVFHACFFFQSFLQVFLPSLSLQLMGSFVLAVGLWLRFDPETVSLLNGDKAPDTFFIGGYHGTPRPVQTAEVHTV